MKKFLVLFVLATCFANFSFGESRETQIANSIEKARYVNYMMGIKDPNKIQPGQIVFVPIPAKKGDTEWWIYNRALPWNEVLDTTVYYDDPTPNIDPENETPQKANLWDFISNLPWWVWLIIALIIFAIIGQIHSEKKKWRKEEWSKDPVTSGEPFYQNGVTDEEIHKRVAEIIQDRYRGATFVIKSIRRGVMNGQAIVWYKGEPTPKERIFVNQDGYEAITEINDREEIVYTLQGCGNPIVIGDFFKAGEDFTFTANVIINEDGSKNPLPQEQGKDSVSPEQIEEARKSLDEKTETVEVKKQKAVEVAGSESFRLKMKSLEIFDKALETNEIHNFKLELKADGEMIVDVKYKFNTDTKNETTKKNEKNKGEDK